MMEHLFVCLAHIGVVLMYFGRQYTELVDVYVFQIWLTWEEMFVSFNQTGRMFAGENFHKERTENGRSHRQSRHLK